MNKYIFSTILLVCTFLLYGQFSAREVSRFGSIPDLISFQGRLTDSNGNPINVTMPVRFYIYDSEVGGEPIWEETPTISIIDGLFQVNLGEVAPLNETYFNAETRWLTMRIDPDAEMTPRIRITSVPYSLSSVEIDPTWSGDANTTGVISRTGNVGIGTDNPSTQLHVDGDNFLVSGTHGTGQPLNLGFGTKMFFNPHKSAFRAGYVNSMEWNDQNIGEYSIALGYNTTASAYASIALGQTTLAGATNTTAMGIGTTAIGTRSTAMGDLTTASGTASTAMGSSTTASGDRSTAMGRKANAEGAYSFAINLDDIDGPLVPANTFQISGATNTIISEGSVGIGTATPVERFHVNNGNLLASGTFGTGTSLTVEGIGTRMFFYPRKAAFRAGRIQHEADLWNEANIGLYSTAFGYENKASGNFSTALGRSARAEGAHSFAVHLSSASAPVVPDNTFRISGAANTIISEGNVGIGTSTPSQKLDVDGQLRIRGGNPGAGRFLISDATGVASWEEAATLVESDPTWSGDVNTTGVIGRTGNVGIGTAAPSTKLHVNDGILMTTGAFNSGPELPAPVTSPRMFFYPRKAAFRAGSATGEQWNDGNVGNYSTAMGYNTEASGLYSTAMGGTVKAQGDYSTAFGASSEAIGNRSTAMGNTSLANGLFSTAIGDRTVATGMSSTALGRQSRALGNYSFAVNLSSVEGPEVPANTFQISGATNTIISEGNFLSIGTLGTDPSISVSDGGTRMFFYPRKAAFRAGSVSGTQWDDANIGTYSVAMGFDTRAEGEYSTAMGYMSVASGDYATAMGSSAASGYSSTAMGFGSSAQGYSSTAIGDATFASGENSTAMGSLSRAIGNYSFAVNLNDTNGPDVPAHTFQISGATNTIISEGNVGIGTDSPIEKLHIDDGILLTSGNFNWGPQLTVGGSGSRMFFYPRKAAFRAGGVYETQWNNENIGNYSTAMGWNTIASASGSTAMGASTTASGGYSTAFGYNTSAEGEYSIAMGVSTTASGDYSTAMGIWSTANGWNSTAMGYETTASEDTSTAMGRNTTASGSSSTAMGRTTTASGSSSTAMGYETTAEGVRSTAMGSETTASGWTSTAMGYDTIASGSYSTAMGYRTRANGDYSTAMGMFARAANSFSFAINLSDSYGPLVAERTFRISGATEIGGNLPWTNHSDRRLKKEIENLQQEDNLAKILRLNGVRFRWTDHDKNLNLGFIAQDVEDIVPESVRYDEINDIYSMEYTALIPVLVEAIKEQQKQIEELQLIIRDLKENLDK